MHCKLANSSSTTELARALDVVNPVQSYGPARDLMPGDEVPVLRCHPVTCKRSLDLLTWGLVPEQTQDINRARRPVLAEAKAVLRSTALRDSLLRRRCLIPSTMFYRWMGNHTGGQVLFPSFGRTDGRPMMIAGIWDVWWRKDGTAVRTFLILTSKAAGSTALGAEMPVIIPQSDMASWLGRSNSDAFRLLSLPDRGASSRDDRIRNSDRSTLIALKRNATRQTRQALNLKVGTVENYLGWASNCMASANNNERPGNFPADLKQQAAKPERGRRRP